MMLVPTGTALRIHIAAPSLTCARAWTVCRCWSGTCSARIRYQGTCACGKVAGLHQPSNCDLSGQIAYALVMIGGLGALGEEQLQDLAYPTLVFVHLLLFVLWLGADVGVFILGQHFRRRHRYSLEQRLALLKLLVEVDMVPRTAWALMVPVSLSVVAMGGFWAVPDWLLIAAWAVGAIWLWLVWDAHLHDQTPRAVRNRKIEFWLKVGLALFYLGLGLVSLQTGSPLGGLWLALKALLFGIIFAAAIMIDVAFRPVGPQLGQLINEGSSDATEVPLLRTMNTTRIWVWIVYLLLLVTAYLGSVKPF